jgi:hypothetical protein
MWSIYSQLRVKELSTGIKFLEICKISYSMNERCVGRTWNIKCSCQIQSRLSYVSQYLTAETNESARGTSLQRLTSFVHVSTLHVKNTCPRLFSKIMLKSYTNIERTVRRSNPDGERDILQPSRPALGPPVSYTKRTGLSLLGVEPDRDVALTTHPHLPPRLKKEHIYICTPSLGLRRLF